jgi:hypothetical protein
VEFAALHMVDVADDLLMHVTLIDFFAELLGIYSSDVLPLSASAGPLTPLRGSSPSLDFLIRQGLHQRTASYYLEPSKHNSIEVTYIYSRAANYLAVYATCYPIHLLESFPPIVEPLLSHVSQALSISPNQWARGTDLQHDLHLLASLPRVALIPCSSNATNAMLKIPARPAMPPHFVHLLRSSMAPIILQETYHHMHPRTKMIQRRSTMKRQQQGPSTSTISNAIQTLESARQHGGNNRAERQRAGGNRSDGCNHHCHWAPLPTEPASNTTSGDSATGTTRHFSLPTEQQLQNPQASSIGQLAPSGILAMLASPAVDVVLPYFMRPAQTFNNLVGGMGDVGAQHKVATAKYDLLTLFQRQLSLVSEGLRASRSSGSSQAAACGRSPR